MRKYLKFIIYIAILILSSTLAEEDEISTTPSDESTTVSDDDVTIPLTTTTTTTPKPVKKGRNADKKKAINAKKVPSKFKKTGRRIYGREPKKEVEIIELDDTLGMTKEQVQQGRSMKNGRFNVGRGRGMPVKEEPKSKYLEYVKQHYDIYAQSFKLLEDEMKNSKSEY